ncbi:MAG: DUF1385 domain-containing protein [Thermodesulfobacteriota bacterium]
MADISVGGQAVMEGVMMRSLDRLSIAVREPSGKIFVECRKWFTLLKYKWTKKPFVRGFFVLIETLVNGIKALNFSAQKAYAEETDEEIKPWAIFLTIAASVGIALLLFVVLPHFLSESMHLAALGGNIKSLSFHAWDGLFKFALFLGYIYSISFLPDIKRVFQYHGAEHKVIHAYEHGEELIAENIRGYSRLHPRCGTAFLLFVLSVSILLFTALVPFLLLFFEPQSFILKHGYVLAIKFLLMIPISGIAYEVIRVAGKRGETWWCRLLCLPGLLLQKLTTNEPDDSQLEVAVAALNGALNKEDSCLPS